MARPLFAFAKLIRMVRSSTIWLRFRHTALQSLVALFPATTSIHSHESALTANASPGPPGTILKCPGTERTCTLPIYRWMEPFRMHGKSQAETQNQYFSRNGVRMDGCTTSRIAQDGGISTKIETEPAVSSLIWKQNSECRSGPSVFRVTSSF